CSGTTSWRRSPKGLAVERKPIERTAVRAPLREEDSVQENQTVSEMAEEVLNRQATALAQTSGHSLEDARRAVSDTEAGRQLRELATGEHRHERAHYWRAGMVWDRAEERFMEQIGSEALP